MGTETSKTTQITLRIPKDWLERADTLAPRLSSPGLETGRSDALRVALARGFDLLEEEHGITRSPAAAKTKSAAKKRARA